LSGEEKTAVFRVAQESLTNVAKHAHASRVAVTLHPFKGGVRMQIKDNGRAFQVDGQLGVKGKTRLGLLGMQERVRLVNGHFAVRSLPGKGTTVSVEIPFKTGAAGEVPGTLIRRTRAHEKDQRPVG
jgi:signal transduction histidine kinase